MWLIRAFERQQRERYSYVSHEPFWTSDDDDHYFIADTVSYLPP